MGWETQSAIVEPMYEEARAIAGELGDQLTAWTTLNALGIVAFGARHLDEARQWWQRALASASATGDRDNEAHTRTNLGFLAEAVGDVAAAQQAYEATLAIERSFNVEHNYVVGAALNALGQLALRAGDLAAAAGYLTEALPHFEESAGAGMALHVQGNLAVLGGMEAQRRGDVAAAAQAFDDALRLFALAGNVGAATDQRPFVRQLLVDLHT